MPLQVSPGKKEDTICALGELTLRSQKNKLSENKSFIYSGSQSYGLKSQYLKPDQVQRQTLTIVPSFYHIRDQNSCGSGERAADQDIVIDVSC